jgi:ATP-dependent RNA helicase DDX27
MLRYCPPGRQTLLFSATMTAGVDDLARLSLRKPVRVKTGGGVNTVAPRLVQEFVKLRPGKEHEREAVMAALVCRNFKSRTIVFCETKTETHRLCTVLRVLGAAVSELHGNLSQEERYESLQLFREGKTDVLVATDVAARGLDIPAVRTVINSEMPRSGSTYIHRVGRTARAGSSGRAVTLVSDGRRGVMKKVLKGEGSILSAEAGQVLSRTVPPAVVTEYSVKIAELEESIKRLVKSERDISTVETALREAERAENLLRFEEEISSRPARTWHQTETQKKELKAASKEKVTALVPQQQQLSVKERGLRMAREDNYGEDDGKEKHSVSRKKKRRLEALAQGEGEYLHILKICCTCNDTCLSCRRRECRH